MEWKEWNGKYIFVELNGGGYYSGKVIDVDVSDGKLIWITIVDKFDNHVTFVHSEIKKIVEEDRGE